MRLRFTPFIGVQLLDEVSGGVFYRKLVTVRRRRWTLHVVYRVRDEVVLINYIDPSWRKRTSV